MDNYRNQTQFETLRLKENIRTNVVKIREFKVLLRSLSIKKGEDKVLKNGLVPAIANVEKILFQLEALQIKLTEGNKTLEELEAIKENMKALQDNAAEIQEVHKFLTLFSEYQGDKDINADQTFTEVFTLAIKYLNNFDLEDSAATRENFMLFKDANVFPKAAFKNKNSESEIEFADIEQLAREQLQAEIREGVENNKQRMDAVIKDVRSLKHNPLLRRQKSELSKILSNLKKMRATADNRYVDPEKVEKYAQQKIDALVQKVNSDSTKDQQSQAKIVKEIREKIPALKLAPAQKAYLETANNMLADFEKRYKDTNLDPEQVKSLKSMQQFVNQELTNSTGKSVNQLNKELTKKLNDFPNSKVVSEAYGKMRAFEDPMSKENQKAVNAAFGRKVNEAISSMNSNLKNVAKAVVAKPEKYSPPSFFASVANLFRRKSAPQAAANQPYTNSKFNKKNLENMHQKLESVSKFFVREANYELHDIGFSFPEEQEVKKYFNQHPEAAKSVFGERHLDGSIEVYMSPKIRAGTIIREDAMNKGIGVDNRDGLVTHMIAKYKDDMRKKDLNNPNFIKMQEHEKMIANPDTISRMIDAVLIKINTLSGFPKEERSDVIELIARELIEIKKLKNELLFMGENIIVRNGVELKPIIQEVARSVDQMMNALPKSVKVALKEEERQAAEFASSVSTSPKRVGSNSPIGSSESQQSGLTEDSNHFIEAYKNFKVAVTTNDQKEIKNASEKLRPLIEKMPDTRYVLKELTPDSVKDPKDRELYLSEFKMTSGNEYWVTYSYVNTYGDLSQQNYSFDKASVPGLNEDGSNWQEVLLGNEQFKTDLLAVTAARLQTESNADKVINIDEVDRKKIVILLNKDPLEEIELSQKLDLAYLEVKKMLVKISPQLIKQTDEFIAKLPLPTNAMVEPPIANQTVVAPPSSVLPADPPPPPRQAAPPPPPRDSIDSLIGTLNQRLSDPSAQLTTKPDIDIKLNPAIGDPSAYTEVVPGLSSYAQQRPRSSSVDSSEVSATPPLLSPAPPPPEGVKPPPPPRKPKS